MKKFLFLICLSGTFLTFSALAHSYHPFFLSLDYGYSWVEGTDTQGDLEFNTYQADHLFVENSHLHYQRAPSPRLTLGYHHRYFDVSVALQHVASVIGLRQFLHSTGDYIYDTAAVMPRLAMTTVLAQGRTNLGRGVYIGTFKITPFMDLGLGMTFWDLSSMQFDNQFRTTLSSSGTHLAYEVGLGLDHQISHHLNFDYGLRYTYLTRYRSSDIAAGYDPATDPLFLKQPLSASVFTIMGYISISYTP